MHKINFHTNFCFFIRFPFETKSPIGYIVAIIIQATGICVISMIGLFAILFPVGHCLFLITFTLDLHDEIRMLNESMKIERYRIKKRPVNFHIGTNKNLCKIIQFQCDVKQLSRFVNI